jgi:hypothetical protein
MRGAKPGGLYLGALVPGSWKCGSAAWKFSDRAAFRCGGPGTVGDRVDGRRLVLAANPAPFRAKSVECPPSSSICMSIRSIRF